MGPFGYELYYGTQYFGVPRWDPNFGNYPYNSVPAPGTDLPDAGRQEARNRNVAAHRPLSELLEAGVYTVDGGNLAPP